MAAYNHYQPIGSNIWIVAHGLNSTFLALDAMKLTSGGVYEKVMPVSIEIIDANTIATTFPSSVVGRMRIVSAT